MVVPVSYTHLDVYKRQLYSFSSLIDTCNPCATVGHVTLATSTIVTVYLTEPFHWMLSPVVTQDTYNQLWFDSFFVRNTCAFRVFNPLVDTSLLLNSVPVLCWNSSMDFGPNTPTDYKKPVTDRCYSLVQTECGATTPTMQFYKTVTERFLAHCF